MILSLPKFFKSSKPHITQTENIPEYTYIYLLLDPRDNDIRYVGKADNPEARLKDHLNEKGSTYKTRWVQKLIRNDMKPIVKNLCRIPYEEWEYWEVYFIKFYKKLGCRLTNSTAGGEYGGSTAPRSEKYREYIRKRMTGQPLSKETIAKIVAKNTGKKRSEQAREHMKSKYIGVTHSDKTKELLRKQSSQRTHSEETKRKLSELSKKVKSRKARPVLQLDLNGNLIKRWESTYQAIKEYGECISECIRGKQKTSKGFIWLYEDSRDKFVLPNVNKSKVFGKSRPVIQLDLKNNKVKDWKDYREAQKVYGRSVYVCLIGNQKTAYGYKWRFQ